MNDFEIGTVRVGSGSLFLIAGPCVIESETHARFMADSIQRITSDLHLPYIFKASYDKANRTSAKGFRGPGLEEGAGILGRIAEATGLPVITDVHQPDDCERVAEAVDVLPRFPPSFAGRPTCCWRRPGPGVRSISRRASLWRRGICAMQWRRLQPLNQSTGCSYRTWLLLWIQQPGGRHALFGHHAQYRSGDFRRHPLGADPFLSGGTVWRPTGVYPGSGPGRRRRRCRRSVPGSSR